MASTFSVLALTCPPRLSGAPVSRCLPAVSNLEALHGFGNEKENYRFPPKRPHRTLTFKGLSPRVRGSQDVVGGSHEGRTPLARRNALDMVKRRARQGGVRPPSAITPFEAPASPPIWRTAASWKRRRKWPTIPRPAQHSSTTGAPMRSRSTRLSALSFSAPS